MKRDKRVIDLRKEVNYVPWPQSLLHMTMCAGDGKQNNITDIEYFTQKYEGYSRDTKHTNIFCCSPDYNSSGIEENKKYMKDHPDLDILLVLCDTKNTIQLDRFKTLFANKLSVIQEDLACYGATLTPDLLYDVLVPGGYYMLDDYQRIRNYMKNDTRFSYNEPSFNKLIITKLDSSPIMYGGTRNGTKRNGTKKKTSKRRGTKRKCT